MMVKRRWKQPLPNQLELRKASREPLRQKKLLRRVGRPADPPFYHIGCPIPLTTCGKLAGCPFLSPNRRWNTIVREGCSLWLAKHRGPPWATSIGSLVEGTVSGLPDDQLLDRFLATRDGAAFEALMARHGPMVLKVCRAVLRNPSDAEDAFQATFLVLVKKARTLRGRANLGDGCTWLPTGSRSRPTPPRPDDACRRGGRARCLP